MSSGRLRKGGGSTRVVNEHHDSKLALPDHTISVSCHAVLLIVVRVIYADDIHFNHNMYYAVYKHCTHRKKCLHSSDHVRGSRRCALCAVAIILTRYTIHHCLPHIYVAYLLFLRPPLLTPPSSFPQQSTVLLPLHLLHLVLLLLLLHPPRVHYDDTCCCSFPFMFPVENGKTGKTGKN